MARRIQIEIVGSIITDKPLFVISRLSIPILMLKTYFASIKKSHPLAVEVRGWLK